LFPSTTFVIGADTAERLVAPKYYGDDEARMHVALEEIANLGSSFLVAVRIDAARTRAERHPRAAALCRSLHRNPRAPFPL
jgi:hypothetical protein